MDMEKIRSGVVRTCGGARSVAVLAFPIDRDAGVN